MTKVAVSLLFGIVLSAELLLGQVTTGTISGLVRDTTGAVVPGATVTARNAQTGISRNVATDGSGRYRVSNLNVGTYQVQAEMPGFQTAIRSGITLTVGREAVVNLNLEVGQVTETVEVTGEAPLINTTSATVAGLVDEKTIVDLPLNGRSFVQLATLQPGVNPMVTNSDPALSIAGGRSTENNFLLDGITTNNEQNKTPTSASGEMLGVEAIREFSVLTSNFSAEYGRGGGGIINAVTKSGTNQFHGSVFEFLRNDNLDARNFFDREKPEFKRNQFGFSLGGPIVRNRTFFFGTFEALRQRLGQTEISRTFGPKIRQGFAPTRTAGEFIEVGVHPAVKPYLDLFPLPNGQLFPDGTGDFIFTNSQPTDEDFFQVRVDHHFSPNDSIFGRYTFSDSETSAAAGFPGVFTVNTQRNHFVTLEESRIFSPTVLNVFRLGFNRSTPKQVGITPDLNPSLSFVPGQPMGEVGVSGVTGLGVGSSPFKTQGQNSFQVLDNVSVMRGAHSLKFGFWLERLQDNFEEFTRLHGVYAFDSIRDFLENRAARLEIVPPGDDLTRGVRQTLLAWYVQDDIQITPRFTLNLGLRHELFTTPTEVNGKVPNIRNIFLPDPVHVGDPFLENPSHNDFAPRFGFAWSPFQDGKTSVRGGFGIYRAPILAFQIDNTFTNMPPFSRRARIENPPFPNGLDAVGGASFLFLPKSTEFEPASTYTMRWNLTVEREILPSTMFSASYIASRGVHLSHLRDMNEPLPTSIIDGREFRKSRAPRRNTAFSEVRQTAFDSSSVYHSLQLNVKRRFSRGWQFQTAYTWSRSIDTASSGGAKREFRQSTSIATSPDNINFDRGLSNFDVRHLFVANFTYELPFGSGRPYLSTLSGVGDAILGGWALNGIISLSTGTPVTVRAGGDWDNNDERDADRPNLVAGKSNNPVLGDPDAYFEVSSFELPERGFRGNLGRNTVIGPGLANVDLSLFKTTNFTERLALQFRLEAFNIFNRVNFQPPSFPELVDQRGRPTALPARITRTATRARQLQFGLKLVW